MTSNLIIKVLVQCITPPAEQAQEYRIMYFLQKKYSCQLREEAGVDLLFTMLWLIFAWPKAIPALY
jgi:hypothetical protein